MVEKQRSPESLKRLISLGVPSALAPPEYLRGQAMIERGLLANGSFGLAAVAFTQKLLKAPFDTNPIVCREALGAIAVFGREYDVPARFSNANLKAKKVETRRFCATA
jgi:hypothetical protein